MISVVCVYNNENTLKEVLLKSLRDQTVEFELITLDNRDGRFKSAAEALNYGGAKAKGEYIMFAHQDMWLGSNSWLEDVEGIIRLIPDLGVAGVAGMSDKGSDDHERRRWSIEDFGELRQWGLPAEKPEEVQTLDECLLIVPRPVFDELKFDEKTFDGWDCYGADYCLCVRQLGLKAYVIPAYCRHSCLRAHYRLWEFKGLLESQRKLYAKHRKDYRHIYSWMGEISWKALWRRRLAQFHGPLYLRLFPDLRITLGKALSGCDSILDLGCGPLSLVHRLNIPFSVGVVLFEPYLQESKRRAIHSQYVRADVTRVEFKPKSFDAVIAVELLESLTKGEGAELLRKMEKWARKRVVITTLSGYIWQDDYDSNPFQEHKSGWCAEELREFGFEVHGMSGWRKLRGYRGSLRYGPPFLRQTISGLTQKITYYYPKLAFQLVGVKRLDHGHCK